MWAQFDETIKEEREERERLVRASALELFNKTPDFDLSMDAAVEEFYHLVHGMDNKLGDVVLSFMPNLENYLNIFATHLLIIEKLQQKQSGEAYDPADSWNITGEHIDMAMEILYDVFERLIIWLESDLELGAAKAEKVAMASAWKKAIASCKTVDLGGKKGDGWVTKKELLKVYGRQQERSDPVVYNHYRKAKPMFKETKVNGRPHVKWNGDEE
tara:strand:- start:674 stop:1318 length:645 start_codon:yes stop_codon:yes gene_type:complete